MLTAARPGRPGETGNDLLSFKQGYYSCRDTKCQGKEQKIFLSLSPFSPKSLAFFRFELLGNLHNAARAEALRAELDEVLGILNG